MIIVGRRDEFLSVCTQGVTFSFVLGEGMV